MLTFLNLYRINWPTSLGIFSNRKNTLAFYEICLFRIFFLNHSFGITELRIFLNLISSKLCNIFFCELSKVKVLVLYHQKNKKMFFDINFKEHFFRTIYIKQMPFPNLKSTFKLKPNYFDLKNIIFRKKIKNILFFLNHAITYVGFFSIQFILFLKAFRLIQNSLYKNEIKITHFGMHFTLCNLNLQFFKNFNTFLKQIFILFSKKKSFLDFFRNYFIFKINNKHNFKKVPKNKFKSILNLFFKINNKHKIHAPRLFHLISSMCRFFFWFCHEIEILFSPCFSDNLFYTCMFSSREYTEYGSNNNSTKKSSGKFQITIESNYRLYAYNNNNFLNSVLLEFCDLLYILPYLFVGEVTKMSIYNALKKGIAGKNIIGFVKKNLYNTNLNTCSLVINQIRAWEIQRKKSSFYDSLITIENYKKHVFQKCRKTGEFLKHI